MACVLHHDLVVVQLVAGAVPAAVEGAVVVGAGGLGVFVEADHIRPDLIYIGLLAVVVHVRGVAAGGAHIHLQAQHIALLAQPLLVLAEYEELQVDEPALHAEGLDGPQACGADVLRHVLHQVIGGVPVVVDDVHNGFGGDIAALKQGLALGIHNGIEGLHVASDVLLHDVHPVVLVVHEERQVFVRGELVGVVGPHAVVRLDHHGVAHGVGEVQGVLRPLHNVPSGCGQTGLGIVFLHGGLELDLPHILNLGAGGDVEFRPQLGIPHEPVLIVGFQPVDLAVLEGEEGHGLEDLVVVFQAGHLIIFIQTVPQLLQQVFIGTVADPQHPHAVFL